MIRAEHERLGEFLRSSAFPEAEEVAVIALERPGGGASWETFLATLAVRQRSSERTMRVVLKRAPAEGAMAPYEIAKDVAILRALAGSEIPVPPLLAFTEDPGVFSRPFTVTAFVDGESPDLTKVERWSTWQQHRVSLGLAIIDLAAALAQFRWQGTGLEEVTGPRGGAAARVDWMVNRYLAPLMSLSEEHGIPQPFCRDVGMWLKENVFELPEERLCLVHGDFRFGNFLFEGCSIVCVLDWERAMLGDPMSNLGFFCMPISRKAHPELMGKALPFAQLEDRYHRVHGLELSPKRLQYYMIFWQFLECVNSTRNLLEAVVGTRPGIGSRGLIAPNLLMRQTLQLIDAYEAGRHEIV